MKLHTVFITHDRLDLTKQSISTFLETVTVSFTFVVVDNASTDGTCEWLGVAGYPHICLPENRYPGYAANRGWEHAPADADFLQRADNDFAFLPGWTDQVEMMFQTKKIGQVGLRTDEEELFASWNVGGNCVIRRELWDQGLRYDERPWPEYPPGYSEDSFFSPEVQRMGYSWRRVPRPAIRSLASGDLSDPYYVKSYGDRRIINPEDYRQQLGVKK